MPPVTKRDGTVEAFQPQKIIAVLEAAGLEPAPAAQIAAEVSSRVAAANTPTITSLQIRDLVIQLLEAQHPYIAGLYKWYQKTKDASINV